MSAEFRNAVDEEVESHATQILVLPQALHAEGGDENHP